MSQVAASEALARHRIPVIDRMMDVLLLLERRGNGATIRDLVEELELPRTTVYRILNTLQFHDMVRRSGEGSYRLGPRLLTLAARAGVESRDYDLVALAQPHLQRLATDTGEGCKVSIIDGGVTLVVAAIDGQREYALTVIPGQRQPIHTGAASKVLLAGLPKAELDTYLSRPLTRYTNRTLTDPRRLAAELARIRRQGWAQDRGEYSPSVHAFAAPIRDGSGTVIAALSVPFLAGTPTARMEMVRAKTIAFAAAISAELPAPRGA